MKNIFKMKGNTSKIIATFVLLLFLVCYACMEEWRNSLENEANSLAIESAKSWYEANKPEETAFRSVDGKTKIPAKPDWNDAFTMKNERYEVVETNLMTQGGIIYIDKECMKKYEETKDRKYTRTYSRIVFRTDKATGKTSGFLMTLVPNLEWLEKSNFKPFKHATYLDRGKDFGGTVYFHNMDGSFSNGWVYEKGKITGRISSMREGAAEISLRSDDICYLIDWYYVIWDCPW